MLTAQADGPDDGLNDGPKIVYKKQTEIDFEAIELQGELVKPLGNFTIEKRKATFNPFIELRKDFDEEMSQSIAEIK
tara:strand:+ start:5039 stop:5269 length:231 start_codon:yes stop_codon:yes gene_type:complete